jgi:uncharacterized membrane protein
MQAAVSGKNNLLYAAVALLSLAGIVDSAFALQRHHAKSKTQFCDISEQFSCDIVNRSEYSTILGIPVAAIGVLGYATLFSLSTWWKLRPETPSRLLLVAILGFLFALYLTYIEARELMTWCILCLISQGLIFLICVFSGLIKVRSPQP